MTHPGLIDDKTMTKFFGLIEAGDFNGTAAKKCGFTFRTFQHRMSSRPEWAERFEEACAKREESLTDELRNLTLGRARDLDDPKSWDALKKLLEAYVPEFRPRTTVETTVSGSLEMRTPEVVEAIERFTASVVQASARIGTRQAPAELDRPANGRAGLPVGRVDS